MECDLSNLNEQLHAARAAAQVIAAMDSERKRALIHAMAQALADGRDAILTANARDVDAASAAQQNTALIDRLRLNPSRLDAVVAALDQIAELPDPVGEITHSEQRPNGLSVQRVRIPLGVIAMIYEARPNVTADAASLCLMAGNAVVLRGGSEALHSNQAIAAALHGALAAHGVPEAALTLIVDTDRERIRELVQAQGLIDLVIPRGGEGLIRFVTDNARVPVIQHYQGVCHLYVDASADPALALKLLIDGKTTRPAVCNALETMLVHRDIAATFIPNAVVRLRALGVQVRGCPHTQAIYAGVVAASASDFGTEFLDRILAVRVVDDIDQAIAHIQQHGSDHTEVIATRDTAAAERFIHGLRSAVVMVNASSRFSDGGELGLGAEIGISTSRVHAYGPMGLNALTIERWVVRGEGQVRHG